MVSYNSNTKIEMEIDGVKVNIDGISMKLFNALKNVAKKSKVFTDKVNKSSNLSDDEVLKIQEEMGQVCIEFLSEVLSEEAYQKLVIDKVEDVFYLMDITSFIMIEIKSAKANRLSRLAEQAKRIYS